MPKIPQHLLCANKTLSLRSSIAHREPRPHPTHSHLFEEMEMDMHQLFDDDDLLSPPLILSSVFASFGGT